MLKAFSERYDLDVPERLLKIATSFGAGLGAAKCCCGSLTGGVLVLSLISGRSTPDVPEGPAFEAASTLHNEFKKRYQATCCRVLTRTIEWGTPEHHQYCEQFVYGATIITADILAEKFKIYPKSDTITIATKG